MCIAIAICSACGIAIRFANDPLPLYSQRKSGQTTHAVAGGVSEQFVRRRFQTGSASFPDG
jgi:hypothetical protein